MSNPHGDKVRKAGNSGRVVGKTATGYDAIATRGPVGGIARPDTGKREIASRGFASAANVENDVMI